MRTMVRYLIFVLVVALFLNGCASSTVENQSSAQVNKQQDIYNKSQPMHIYDYSIPKDVLQQIYDMVTTQSVATYTVVESVTGETKYQCPSIGFPIPADTQLTNPLQLAYRNSYESPVIEQPEPNGLFTSKNTDGTWVLCVNKDGAAYPYYTEHKASGWPFPVQKDKNGEWHQVEGTKTSMVVDTTQMKKDIAIRLANDTIISK